MRLDAVVTFYHPCASVCAYVESELVSAQQPEDVRSLVCAAVSSTTGEDVEAVLSRWDSAEVRWRRPLAEAVALLQERGHAHASRLGDALVRMESLSHVSLVWHQAHKVAHYFPGYAASDLVGWGWSGLRMALNRFDPSLGFAFSTYACTRIVGSMRDGVRAERPVPKRLGTFQRQLERIEESMSDELGRPPSIDELAAASGEPREKVMAAHRARGMVSLDEMLESRVYSATPLHEPSFDLSAVEVSTQLSSALSALDPDLATAVTLSVVEGASDAEVASALGCSVSEVDSIRSRALLQLRSML